MEVVQADWGKDGSMTEIGSQVGLRHNIGMDYGKMVEVGWGLVEVRWGHFEVKWKQG